MLQEFLSELKKTGVAKPNLFAVEITFPAQARNGISGDFFNIFGVDPNSAIRANLFCETTELPGRSIQTNPIKTHGNPIKIPYNMLYDDVPMVFYVGSDMQEKRFFDAWQHMIVDTYTGDLNYYNEYTSTIKITQLDQKHRPVYTIQLKKAFPMVISPVTLGHGETNNILRLPVNFTYSQWEYIPTDNSQSFSFGDVLMNTGILSNKLNRKIFEIKQLTNRVSDQFNTVKNYTNYFSSFR